MGYAALSLECPFGTIPAADQCIPGKQHEYSTDNASPLSVPIAGAPLLVGARGSRKNSGSHIDASHSRQPLVKGERLVRYEVNAVMHVTSSCNPRVLGKQYSTPPVLLSVLKKQYEISLLRRHSGIARWKDFSATILSMTLQFRQAYVTPKGVLPLTWCHVSATHEGP